MKWNVPFKLLSTIGLIAIAQQTAFAAVLPGSVLPDQVSRALRAEEPKPTANTPVIAAPQQPADTGMGAEAQKIKFQLNGIEIVGNHVYSTAELSMLYKSQLHKTISVADLFAIVQNITNYYRNNGYILSRAILPPQHVKGGVVKVQIVEGYIGDVTVAGTPYGVRDQVLGYGHKIKECPPLKLQVMERYMILANELPSTDVKAVLSPSKNQVGAADLTLVTQLQRVTGYASYDNYGTRYIGPQQMTANIGFNSFITAGDNGQMTFTKTPKGGELTYTDINYSMPLDYYGTRLLIGGTRAQTHPLFVLAPTAIDGLNNNYYTSLMFPIIRSRTESLTLRTGFNYQDSDVTALNSPLYDDHLRSIGLGGTYNFADSWYGSNLIGGDFRQGLPLFGYTSDTDNTAATSRPGGRGNYTKLMGTVSRLQAIKGPVSLYAVANGQFAFNPLLSSEQFSFGGSQLGRGYDVAEIIGDKGASGSLELRYDLGVGRYFISALQFYAFYDAGAIWNKKVAVGTPAKASAMSTGAGVRFYMTRAISGNVMWTQPLTKQVAAEELIGRGKRPRVFFSIVASL